MHEEFDSTTYARTSENNMPSVGAFVALTADEQVQVETALRLS